MKHKFIALLICLFGGLWSKQLQAQSGVQTPEVSQDGFRLSKSSSNSTVCTGEEFQFVLHFTLPEGATKVTITDVVPAELNILTGSLTIDPSSMPLSAPPYFNGNVLEVTAFPQTAAPQSISGTISFMVQFPPGEICDGFQVHNQATLTGLTASGGSVSLITETLTVTAEADNFWGIVQYITPEPNEGCVIPTTQTFTHCTRIAFGRQLENECQDNYLNIHNAIFTDPIAHIPRVTFNFPNGSGWYINSDGNPEINIGNMTYANSGALYFGGAPCYQVIYPIDANTVPMNYALGGTLTGTFGNNCGQSVLTPSPGSQTSIHLAPPSAPALIAKEILGLNWHYLPGCQRSYRITICNSTGMPLNNVTISDMIPAGIDVDVSAVTFTNNLTFSDMSLPLLAFTAAQLAPFQNVEIIIPFTITGTPGTQVLNTAVISDASGQIGSDAANFTIQPEVYRTCLKKVICDKKEGYLPGETLRYRLLIENNGTGILGNSTITDVLSPYLTYGGSWSGYWANTNINTLEGDCNTPANANAWPCDFSFDAATNTLTWEGLGDIHPITECTPGQGCFPPGQVFPYYVIEFDAIIRDTTPCGNIENAFQLVSETEGGDMVTFDSPIEVLPIICQGSFVLEKTLAPGSDGDLQYALNLTNTGASLLTRALLLDEMPLNATDNDETVLGCLPTNSDLGMHLTPGSDISNPPNAGFYTAAPTGISEENLTSVGTTPLSGPHFTVSGACASAPYSAWDGPGSAMSGQNLYFDFGEYWIASNDAVTGMFDVDLPDNQYGNVCNSAAANAAIRMLVEGGSGMTPTYIADYIMTPVETTLCDSVQPPASSLACCQTETTFDLCVRGVPNHVTFCLTNQSAIGNDICQITLHPSNDAIDWGTVTLDGTPITNPWDANDDLMTYLFAVPVASGENHCFQMNHAGLFSGAIEATIEYCNHSCDSSLFGNLVW